MTRGTRRRLFYVFLILFVIVGISVILYAEGWRINLSTFTTEKVGAIYVSSLPENADIYLNGKQYPNQASFLNHGTFISNLFPKTYQLTLHAEGYDAWEEDAQVLPSLVAQFKYAVLVPKGATTVATSESVQAFFESGGGIVTQNTSNTIAWTGGVAGSGTIGNGTIIDHSPGLTTLIFRTPKGLYYSYDFSDNALNNLTKIFQTAGMNTKVIGHIAIDPYEATTAYVITGTRVWSINLAVGTATTTAIALQNNFMETPLAIGQTFLAWAESNAASGTSRIVVYNKLSQNRADDSLVLPSTITQLQWINGNLLGILQSDGQLFTYNFTDGNLAKVADDVKSFFPNSDGTMIAALERAGIEVFSLVNSDYYRVTPPNINAVSALIWYKDDMHLFLQYPNQVAFLDLQDINLRNFTIVSLGTNASYDSGANSLYLIDQGHMLLRFDFPQ